MTYLGPQYQPAAKFKAKYPGIRMDPVDSQTAPIPSVPVIFVKDDELGRGTGRGGALQAQKRLRQRKGLFCGQQFDNRNWTLAAAAFRSHSEFNWSKKDFCSWEIIAPEQLREFKPRGSQWQAGTNWKSAHTALAVKACLLGGKTATLNAQWHLLI